MWRKTRRTAYKPTPDMKEWMIKTARDEAIRSKDIGYSASGNALVMAVVVGGDVQVFDCKIERIESTRELYDGPPDFGNFKKQPR